MFKRFISTAVIVFGLAALLMLAGCGNSLESVSDNSSKDKTTIGIIAALECEIDILRDNLEDVQTYEIAGTEYYSGTIGNHEVICMQCGMGKVSASLGAQAMIMQFDPDIIINTGCAGALAEELEVGDIVLADSTVEWDLDTIDLGNPRGYVSAMDKVVMTADEAVTDQIADVIGDDAEIYRGMIVSGDQFVSTDEQRNLIFEAFPDALCTEMEGGAIGHVCEQNGVPFCVIRCISDNANGDSSVNIAEFSEAVGKKSAGYLLEYLSTY